MTPILDKRVHDDWVQFLSPPVAPNCLTMCRLLTRRERRARRLGPTPKWMLPACQLLTLQQRDDFLKYTTNAMKFYAQHLAFGNEYLEVVDGV